MEPTHVYVKKRVEFGRQCVFDSYGPVLDEDIQPDPVDYQYYVKQNPRHVASQKSKQYAAHEVQTFRNPSTSTGMFHSEGGWPKDIDPKDEEATTRFRRRIEKDDDWAPKLRHLFRTVEHGVRQNNTVNIHQHYFDDIAPSDLVTPHSLRVVNVYTDTELEKGPVNWISWSPDRDMKIIVSYCLMDFQKFTKVQPHTYVWSIENSNVPVSLLKTFSPLVVSEFHPRDSIRVASGLMTGQVCIWDLRKIKKPVALSRSDSSHSYPISSLKWIQSRNGCEFFSSSFDGQAMWWDMRNMQKPTSILIFDLEKPRDPNLNRAFGVSCMNFEPTVATKFLIGLENGVTISGSKKSKNPEENMSLRFNSHCGPVISVDRNRSIPKCFLSIGDWTARVWSEDAKESALVSTRYFKKFLTGGCWSRSRHSLFYTINRTGHLKSWDLLQDLQTPVTSLRLCSDLLTTISHHDDEPIMAIGSNSGNVYLVKASDGLVRFSRDEKSNFTAYIDRCSRFAKAVEARRKELKLSRRIRIDEDNGKEDLDKGLIFEVKKNKGESIREKKSTDKPRSKTHEFVESQNPKDPELLEAESAYFQMVDEELSKLNRVVDLDDDFLTKEHSNVTSHSKDRRISGNLKSPKTRIQKRRDFSNKEKNMIILKTSKLSDIRDTGEMRDSMDAKDPSKLIISKTVKTIETKVLLGPVKISQKLKPLLSSKACKAPCAMEICSKDISAKIKGKKQLDKRDEKLSRNLTREHDPDAEMKTWKRIPGLGSWKSSESFTRDEKTEIMRNMSAPPEKMAQVFTRRMSHVAKRSEPD